RQPLRWSPSAPCRTRRPRSCAHAHQACSAHAHSRCLTNSSCIYNSSSRFCRRSLPRTRRWHPSSRAAQIMPRRYLRRPHTSTARRAPPQLLPLLRSPRPARPTLLS
ncbi:hypothetical protein IWW45_009398, partial [Coemansia sp. RSA 485]